MEVSFEVQELGNKPFYLRLFSSHTAIFFRIYKLGLTNKYKVFMCSDQTRYINLNLPKYLLLLKNFKLKTLNTYINLANELREIGGYSYLQWERPAARGEGTTGGGSIFLTNNWQRSQLTATKSGKNNITVKEIYSKIGSSEREK